MAAMASGVPVRPNSGRKISRAPTEATPNSAGITRPRASVTPAARNTITLPK